MNKHIMSKPIREGVIKDEREYLKKHAEEVFKSEGKKYDDGKLEWHLMPVEGVEDMLKVMQFGAKKYGDYNWYKGMDWHRLFNAGLRHLWAWFRGEDIDPESGLPHLAHASCCVLMLASLVRLNRGKDTRPK